MTDVEFAREIAQPLTDQSGDYAALDQSGASTRTQSQTRRETETASAMISHEVLSECDAASHRFGWPMSKRKDRSTR
jgi:hypothetical protein